MSDYLKLIHNENIKIYIRARTWIMFAILLIAAFGVPMLARLGGADKIGMWAGMGVLTLLSFLLTVFAASIAADSVAGEFSRGTVKMLLIRPWSRTKILFAKYAAVLLFLLAVYAFFFGLGTLSSFLLLGGGGEADGIALTASSADIQEIWTNILYRLIASVVYVTLAFMLSAAFRSNMLALALTVVFMFMGGIVTQLVDPSKYAIGRYLLFANTDLNQYAGNPQGDYGVTSLGFSLGVLAVYFVVFLIVGVYVFRKRDVAA
ncbi:DUF2705 family protein [Saccharibacillus sp. CPCC 101409]|uniref:ABC transporter permease n=1 Tax=Saccharibacillus sp. CPCC 101409 TaxID=3058041 RepID=UPI002672604E|nr:DUF2705 family protein [Saccharibacillus sp. CPCC 101409]MDO3408581.1 DUF2705 family protein [Saccharibacillus sp. CPCC 101409]